MPQFLLDFRSLRAVNPRTFSERRSFRPAAQPERPEANARQRDAPSGAKVFGISVTGSVAEAPSRTQVKPSPPATGSRLRRARRQGPAGGYERSYGRPHPEEPRSGVSKD